MVRTLPSHGHNDVSDLEISNLVQPTPVRAVTVSAISLRFRNLLSVFLKFVLRRLDVDDALELLNKAFEALDSLGKKIIITVSPVPLSLTFTSRDCVIANEYSKSVLRVCAEQLCERFRYVDYYPSYEIVRAVGLSAYEDDNVQVRNVLVRKITRNMLHVYSRDRK